MKSGAATTIAQSLLLCGLILLTAAAAGPTWATDQAYHQFVILGDPHLPGKDLATKEQVIRTINAWSDAQMVVAVGDLCEDRGTEEEYAAVRQFFAGLHKPLYPVTGNHDFFYEDNLGPRGRRIRAGTDAREAKLAKFRATFDLAEIFYARKAGNYLLIFLSADSPEHLAQLSERQVEWLRAELVRERQAPTIIFFHAPLSGTLRNYNSNANTPNFVAQPAATLRDILAGNPQVFLWVSGHTHTSPREESFASAINVYATRVMNIHNTDMNRKTIWTNSLFLYPDKVVVRTYDHQKGAWLPEFDRTILPPAP